MNRSRRVDLSAKIKSMTGPAQSIPANDPLAHEPLMVTGPVQDLSTHRLPPNFRGRPAWFVQIWWLAQSLLFHTSPQAMYGWRRFLLKLFGAKIGRNVMLR